MEYTAPMKTSIESSGITDVSFTPETKTFVDNTFNLIIGFLKMGWDLINFWPVFLIEMLDADSNLQPTTSKPSLLVISIDILLKISIVSLRIIDALIELLGLQIGVIASWIVEIFKDLVVLSKFSMWYKTSLNFFRLADGLRLAAAIPGASPVCLAAAGIAFSSGFISLSKAFAIVEGSHLLSRELGMDDKWSAGYFFAAFIIIFRACLKGIPDGPDDLLGDDIASKCGSMVYDTLIKKKLDVLSLPSDYNPVTGTITLTFIFITGIYFWFRCIYYGIAALT